MIDALDIIKIHQLLARYGRTIDTRQWDEFEELFVADATIDYNGGRGRTQLDGRANIVAWFRELATSHPPAHHVTNILVDERSDHDGPVEVISKFFAPFTRPEHDPKRLYGGDYRDLVVRTDEGWRFQHKECEPLWNLAITVDDTAPEHRLTF